jgi:hypothetical protein
MHLGAPFHRDNDSPVHHIGLFKYAYDSPAATLYFFCAANRPFFLNTKEDPIKTPLPIARARPNHFVHGGNANLDPPASTILSEEMAADADAIKLDNDFIAKDAEDDDEDDNAAESRVDETVEAAVGVAVIVDMVINASPL